MNVLITTVQTHDDITDRLFEQMGKDKESGVYDAMFKQMEDDNDIYEDMFNEMQADTNGTFRRMHEELTVEMNGGVVIEGTFTRL